MRSIAEVAPLVVAPLDPRIPRLSGALSDTLRIAVWNRDRGLCRYCGRSATTFFRRWGEVDHIVPCLHGGGDELENLALSCHVCNARKGGRTPEEAGMTLLPIPEASNG